MTWAVNVMGYYWMTLGLLDSFAGSREDPAKVVFVASNYAGESDIDDVELEGKVYEENMAYRRSKEANRMLVVPFSERFPTS